MITFRQFQTRLNEAFRPPAGEKVVKTFKVGKRKKYEAVITEKGSSFTAYIDGDKLDVFKNAKEAEKAASEFTDLMGK